MLKKVFLSLAIVSLMLYVVIVGLFYTYQDEIIFYPQKTNQVDESTFAKTIDFDVIEYKSKDGLALKSLLKEPKDKNKPIIMFFNGNAARPVMAYDRLKPLLDKGYGAYINIYRAYGHNPGDPSEDAFFADGQIAYNLLKEKYPNNDIIFYGYSIGTGTAIYLASKNEHKALILEGSFSSMDDLFAELYPIVPAKLILRHRFLSQEYLKDIKSDILMLHGSNDSIVAEKLAKKLQTANPDAKLIVYEDGDHFNLHSLGASQDILKWLDDLKI